MRRRVKRRSDSFRKCHATHTPRVRTLSSRAWRAYRPVSPAAVVTAEAGVRKLIARFPQHDQLFSMLGSLQAAQQLHHAAAETFRRLLERRPDLMEARYNLGITCAAGYL